MNVLDIDEWRMTMQIKRETVQTVLDALVENHKHHQDHDDYGGYPDSDLESTNTLAITALREALAQPEPEPHKWLLDGCLYEVEQRRVLDGTVIPGQVKLYLAPPAPEVPAGWKLVATNVSADDLWNSDNVMSLNAELGLTMDQLAKLARVVIAAAPEYRKEN